MPSTRRPERRNAAGIAPRGRCLAIGVALTIGLFDQGSASTDPPRLDDVDRRAIERGQALVNAGHRAEGFRTLDSLATAAIARRDPVALDWVLVAKAALHSWAGESRAADSLLSPILARIDARGDSALYLSAATWYGKALLDQGRFSAAESIYGPLAARASRCGNKETEGWAQMGLAYVALQSGRDGAARAGYRAALRLLRASGNRYGELEALTGLGRTYSDLDSASACWSEVCSLAQACTQPMAEATALGNLANLEIVRGDPAAGIRNYRAACRILRSAGDRRAEVGPATNLALALVDLGRFDEATSLLDSLIQVCRTERFADSEARLLEVLGRLQTAAGHPRQARQAAFDLLQLGDRVPVKTRLEAYLGLSRILGELGETAEALALLESPAVRQLRSRTHATTALEYDAECSELLLRAGRLEEAARAAEAAAQMLPSLRGSRLEVLALTTATRARMALGDPVAARRHLRSAVEAWERCRDRPTDPEWRERWADGQRLATTLIQTLLAAPDGSAPGSGIATAFEEAQRFKARGLAERFRMIHGGATEDAPVSLDRLRQEILRPGEVLLDAYVGPDSSYLFAIARDRCAVARLPGEAVLAERIGVLLGFLSTTGSSESDSSRALAFREIADGASATLLGGARDLAAGSQRILFVPDGPLHLVPLDALSLESPRVSIGRGEASTRIVARIPSVAHLVRMREEPRPSEVPADRGLVLVGRTNTEGERLEGTGAEARMLTRRFRDFRTRGEPLDSASTASLDWMAQAEILHFAAHADWNEQYPWRSGILLGEARPREAPAILRAERIAASPLSAKLVVISSCESARGRVIRGEGIQGLSTAFLAAGARSVLATLWPVDDRATVEFMSRFYDGLARHATVGESLLETKRSMARTAEYADPFYWAGFILIGEPEQRLALRPRSAGRDPAWGAAAGAASLFVLGIVLRRRSNAIRAKSRMIPEPGKRPT
jgi:tetratricopeptide (TPR) repeat protein